MVAVVLDGGALADGELVRVVAAVVLVRSGVVLRVADVGFEVVALVAGGVLLGAEGAALVVGDDVVPV